VAASAAVLFGEYWRQQHAARRSRPWSLHKLCGASRSARQFVHTPAAIRFEDR